MFNRLGYRLDVHMVRLVITYVLTCLLMLICNWLLGQTDQESKYQLQWSDVDWNAGDRGQVFKILDSAALESPVFMGIEIYTEAKGTFSGFGQLTPYIDGRDVLNFGEHQSLGVMFDPAAGEGFSPVTIKLRFSQPVQYLDFRITDIDALEERGDSLFIYGNGKDIFPKLEVISEKPTVKTYGRTAVAIGSGSGSIGNGSAFGGEENGDIRVHFGEEYLDSVTIHYYETGKMQDPSTRGIGLFSDLSFHAAKLEPMNLLNFGVVLDDRCQPTVRWSTEQEFGLDEFVVEYSYDGYNFFPAGSAEAKNTYTQKAEYDVPLYRALNAENYFRLVRIDENGQSAILTSETMSGAVCYGFTTVNVYPNPSSGNFVFVEIEATEQKPTEIAIIDQFGDLLVKTSYELKSGLNRFKLESRHLVPGIYNLRFAIGQEVVTKQISILP
ncbi:MAG: T9SS type A sorting domain-containing protein [Saprospiraceae bacterium]|nr:T9SS type A sorting domain-containing protein [Saprospiraceae bacterium]